MNGSQIASSNYVTYQGNLMAPDASWNVVELGDFNGDGKADILWQQNTTGSLVEWLMNGSQITSSQNLTSQGQAVTPDASWAVVGTGDFNGDGKVDILWRQSSTGTLAEWLMNGSTISIVEIGDFNGDGNSDILWRQSSTGTLADWTMNGSTISSSQVLGAAPDSTWNIQAKPTDFA
jgi:serralysin